VIASLCSFLHFKGDISWAAGNGTEPKGREHGAELQSSRLWKKERKAVKQHPPLISAPVE